MENIVEIISAGMVAYFKGISLIPLWAAVLLIISLGYINYRVARSLPKHLADQKPKPGVKE